MATSEQDIQQVIEALNAFLAEHTAPGQQECCCGPCTMVRNARHEIEGSPVSPENQLPLPLPEPPSFRFEDDVIGPKLSLELSRRDDDV